MNSPLAYTLVIDEDRDAVLNIMLSFCGKEEHLDAFISFIAQEKKLEAFKSFTEEISDKSHEHGWCPEPEDCEW